MLLIAFILALLVIAAGLKLLIQVQTLGGFLKYTTWFIIGMGFLMLIIIMCFGSMKFYYHAKCMKDGYTYKMGGHKGHHWMMHGKKGHKRMMHARAGSDRGECDEDEMRDGCGWRGGNDDRSDEECYFWNKKWQECHAEVMKDSLLKRNK